MAAPLRSAAGAREGAPLAGLDGLVRAALAEDLGERGDVTTRATVDPTARGVAEVVAKRPLVLAGLEACCAVFAAVDPELQARTPRGEGAALTPGDVALRVEGRLASILTGERVALNFLGRLSGIATLARRFADAVEGTGARILDTRKTTPGWRALEKAAVRAGGAHNHRMGLHDFVLVKDNHIAAAGGITEAVRRVRSDPSLSDLPLEVEVSTAAQLDEVLGLGVDRVLLDNMDREALAAAVRRAAALGDGRPELEASGSVTLENVRRVAETGVDWISVGALTHSAPAADVSLRLVD